MVDNEQYGRYRVYYITCFAWTYSQLLMWFDDNGIIKLSTTSLWFVHFF